MNVDIACICPRKADGEPRHDHDTVTLRETLDFRQATAIRNAVAFAKAEDEQIGSGEMLAILTEGYVLHGIEAWTVQGLDDKGRVFALPCTKTAIREKLLSDPLLAEPIGEAADELYAKAILLPLVARALTSSPPTPTPVPTSPTTPGSRRRPKPSRPSSITTIPMDGTATTTSLRAGDSSSSPSSATAA